MVTTDIQDDWEEIQPMLGREDSDGETVSVLSMSESTGFTIVDEEPTPPSPSLNSTEIDIDSPLAQSTLPPDYEEAISLPEGTKTRPEQDDDDDETASIRSANTITEDLLDIDVEPPQLLSTITHVLETLEETISSSSELDSRLNDLYLKNILSECHALFKLLTELEQVVSCYASAWNPNSDSYVPLDPALCKWTADCMICLLGLQAAIGRETDELDNSMIGAHLDLSADVVQYLSSVIEFREQMENFLPIIKVDLNEYQTADLDFPAEPAPPQDHPFHLPRAPRRNHSRNYDFYTSAPTGAIPTLRRQLYSLKDKLHSAQSKLDEWEAVFAKTRQDSLKQLHAEVRAAFTTLSILLTNHGSDWIDQSLGGGLSFNEFVQLDCDALKKYVEELDGFDDVLMQGRVGVSFSKGKEREVTIDEGRIERLRTVIKHLNKTVKSRVRYEE